MGSPKPSPKIDSIRLQRYLAQCGIGSRRACERLIEDGVVTVDGQVIHQQGVRIDPAQQRVRVRGRPVRRETLHYLALHKPKGYLCTSSDPQGRRTIHDLLPDLSSRLYTVGRLDAESEGLIVVTNDGDFAQALMHPRHDLVKTYRVWSNAPLTAEDLEKFQRGLRDGRDWLSVLSVKPVGPKAKHPCYEIRLGEGKNRHLRRMFLAVGKRVKRLQRVAIGSLTLRALGRGTSRALRSPEIKRLLEQAKAPAPAPRSRGAERD